MTNNVEPFRTQHSNIKLNNIILGFFEGIFIDDQINEIEINALIKWIECYPEVCNLSNFDVLYQLLIKANADPKFLIENRDELNQVLTGFKRSTYFTAGTVDTQRLHGVLAGLLCDGTINDREVVALRMWLDGHKHLEQDHLFKEVYQLLVSVRELNQVDPAVIQTLIQTISKYVDRENYCLPKQAVTSTSENINPDFYHGDFVISGFTFCLTGASERYTKAEWKEVIEAKGGMFTDSLTKKVDYLVICNKGNPHWAHMSYGRKFEQALKWQSEGGKVQILTEDDFVKVLEGNHD
ncbi:BRCT domain-containing protein [Acinetobacter baumannii]|nr:BRCT domain-containing protein [Acinetobacter baumannii]